MQTTSGSGHVPACGGPVGRCGIAVSWTGSLRLGCWISLSSAPSNTSELPGLWKLGSHGLFSASISSGMDVPITYTCTGSTSVEPAHLPTSPIRKTGLVVHQKVPEEVTGKLH